MSGTPTQSSFTPETRSLRSRLGQAGERLPGGPALFVRGWTGRGALRLASAAAVVRVRAAMAEAMGSGRTETLAAVVKAAEGRGVSTAAARLLIEAAEGLGK